MNRILYAAYQANRALTAPAQLGSAAVVSLLESHPDTVRDSRVLQRLAAAHTVLADARLTHDRPAFRGLVDADGTPVEQVVADSTPFADLLHFRQPRSGELPKVLIAAPLSGHFATMLTPTVRTMLLDHDVYITDWHNARDVAIRHGRFGLDEYVDHLVRFVRHLGPGSHLFAVCQPCVPAVMATAALAEDDDPAQPLTLTLMSGPIDTRANPTTVNKISYRQPLGVYRRYLTTVPARFAGAGRTVYPGFLQLSSFLSMNLRRHIDSHRAIYRNLAKGDEQAALRTREFYAEYFAVLDMAGEFYLDTIERIFRHDLLARGEMTHHDRPVRPELIRSTALLTIEASRDDMCAPGQTKAAHELFTGIDASMHRHHLQHGVGHYGVFAGSKWSNEVHPVLRDFIATHGGDPQ